MIKIFRTRWIPFVLAAVMLLSIAPCRAELIPPWGEGQIGLSAVVLCDSLTVRRDRSTSSKTTATLPYGSLIIVVGRQDGWAEVVLSDDVDASRAGWVNASYLAIDPAWYRTEGATPVYAWNDTSAPRVALLDADTRLPVLKIEGDWIIVSLRGAVGWICLAGGR